MRAPLARWIAVVAASLLAVVGLVVLKTSGRHNPVKHAQASAVSSSPHRGRSAAEPEQDSTDSDEPESDEETHISLEQRLLDVESIVDEGADPNRLAGVIAEWADDPDSLPARKSALDALLEVKPAAVRLSSLVKATSPSVALGKDPLQKEMIDATADTLGSANIQSVRDMMLATANPSARQLLASSLAKYASSDRGMAELSAAQKDAIRSDFIDVYHDLPAPQQRDMAAAVEKMSGRAAADLLRGVAAVP